MAERFYRAQILLELEQHRVLAEMASQQKRSISDIVREMIARQLQQQAQEAQAGHLEALERIRQHREALLAQRGGKPLDVDITKLIDEVQEKTPAFTVFWQKRTVAELAAEQDVSSVKALDQLWGDFWPADEAVDDFLNAVAQWRDDDLRA